MKSPIALIGGEEFADGFEEVHVGLYEMARKQRDSHARQNGHPVRVVFLPTCASDDGPETVTYWCDEAQRRLGALSAQVMPVLIVDRASANDPENARLIAEADWIYIGGGYPHVGMRILSGTRALQALKAAHQRGVLITGASAGAMVMGARSWVITPEFDATITELLSTGMGVSEWDMPLPPPLECLGMVPRSMCWPHANQLFSVRWLKNGLLPPGHFVIGIDEQTALVNAGTDGWEVLGRGKVTLVDSRYQVRELPAGSRLERL
jgi:cyanophycinase-like exopeptidase